MNRLRKILTRSSDRARAGIWKGNVNLPLSNKLKDEQIPFVAKALKTLPQ